MGHYTSFIMNHRKWIISSFLVLAIICTLLSNFVDVNYNFADYLPKDSKSTKDLDIMYEEYDQAIPNLRVLVYDVSIAKALEYKEKISAVDGVDEVQWLDDVINVYQPLETESEETINTWYKDENAIFTVTVKEENELETINAIRAIIGEDNAMSGSAVNSALAPVSTAKEIQQIMFVVLPILLVILFITTTSWYEPVLFLFTIGVAILLNRGTNLMFGTISFVTNAAGSVLQLAVSMDYSIFLFLVGYYDFDFVLIRKYRKLCPDGKIYLKTDMNGFWLKMINQEGPKIDVLQQCDLVTVECRSLLQEMQDYWKVPIHQVVNGFGDLADERIIEYEEKENIILHVARLGNFAKSTDVLLKAFAIAAPYIPNWKLKLVGPMEDSFIPFFEQFKNTHPKVMEQIIYEGSIYDRAKLEAEYTKAKVFALSSNGESLPNVYAEAAIKGCFIVCTNLDCARDITNEGKYGITVPVYDYKHFGEALIQACLDEKRLGRLCYAIQLRARREYDWTQLCYQIEEWLHGIK